MQTINIFNQDIVVRDELCSSSPLHTIKGLPSLRLYIKPTDNCNANCLFCANEQSKDFGTIDLKKLEYVINYLKQHNVLHGVSITGGEPMTNPDIIFKILDMVYKIDPNMEVQVSTNGYNLLRFLDYKDVNKLESIHISRHHYDDEINRSIFHSNTIASTEDITKLQQELDDKRIININTIVMKDYIDSLREIRRMLDYASRVGVYKVGFVSLMQCNQFAKDHFINFNDIFSHLDEDFIVGHHFYNGDYCECIDGLYLSEYNKLIEFYARMVKESICPCTNQLVYTSDNRLTKGFTKQLLYK